MEAKVRYLVVHDYGMGADYWWVRAASPAEIVETCAGVEVVSDPATRQLALSWSLEEHDLADPDLGSLEERTRTRARQRTRAGFGVLVGRERVYLRHEEPPGTWRAEGEVFLVELGPDGRKVRQVTLAPDGSALASEPRHWMVNPPFDLYDPDLSAREITAAEFEAAWSSAEPTPDYHDEDGQLDP